MLKKITYNDAEYEYRDDGVSCGLFIKQKNTYVAVYDIDSDLQVIVDAAIRKTEIAKKQKVFNSAIQTHLDNKAKEFRYDNMMSARSYAGYENPFQIEAKKLALWASNCWVKAGEIEVDVQAGNREMPTIDEVVNELPLFE